MGGGAPQYCGYHERILGRFLGSSGNLSLSESVTDTFRTLDSRVWGACLHLGVWGGDQRQRI